MVEDRWPEGQQQDYDPVLTHFCVPKPRWLPGKTPGQGCGQTAREGGVPDPTPEQGPGVTRPPGDFPGKRDCALGNPQVARIKPNATPSPEGKFLPGEGQVGVPGTQASDTG